MNKVILFVVSLIGSQLTAQVNWDWAPLSQSPNYHTYGLVEYQSKLIAVGRFDSIGNMPASRIAAWDGASWSTFGKGLRGGNEPFGTLAYNTTVYNNELYVWGDFDSVGTIKAVDIAKWNGSAWSSFGTDGSNGTIYCTAMYKNELYIGGIFGTTGPTPANMIAKWDGASWQPVGNNSLLGGYVSDLYVYNNELYAVGWLNSVNGSPCNNIAKWNGTAWNTVAEGLPWDTQAAGAGLNEPKFVMTDWNGKLLVGSGSIDNGANSTIEIRQWNGTSWSVFSSTTYPGSNGPSAAFTKVRKFYKHTNKLLAAGGVFPDASGSSHVHEWNDASSSWNALGHGTNYSVRTLCDYKGELYCGGIFNKKQGSYFNYMARWDNVTGLGEETQAEFAVYPNPCMNSFKISFDSQSFVEVEIFDMTGKCVRVLEKVAPGQEIKMQELDPGIYNLKINGGINYKLIKL